MAKSIFIEGMDGSGKSSQITLLKDYLEGKGETVLTLREPGGSDYYEAIREHVHFKTHDRPVLSDALTCAGGIAANIEQTKSALALGSWVISDRAYPSNVVYQASNGLDAALIEQINEIALNGFEYDFKFLIDIPVDVAQTRLSNIGKKKDRYESLGIEYFESVRKKYLELAEKNNYIVLSGEESIEETHKKIVAKLTE